MNNKDKKPGLASFYGTQNTLDEAIDRYKKFPYPTDYYQKTKEALLHQISKKAKNNDYILDIGSSFGAVCIEIGKIYRSKNLDFKLFGIDIFEAQIKNAKLYAVKEGFLDNMRFEVYDARKILDYLDNLGEKFNIFTSLYAFHHIPDSENCDNETKSSNKQNRFRENNFNKNYNTNYLKSKRIILENLTKYSKKDANLIIGDIYLPFSYSNTNYLNGVKSWGELRIDAAKKVSMFAKDCEINAQDGIFKRMNEYPITFNEMNAILKLTNWQITDKKVIFPYNDVIFTAINS